MKQLDKLKTILEAKLNQNKKILNILILLSIIGFILGIIFVVFIAKNDHTYIKEYMSQYIKNINDGNINYLVCFKDNFLINIVIFIFIFLLGISVIGIPIIVLIYFTKIFIIGFSITSFILSFKLKGLLYVLIYLIPNIIMYIMLTTIVLYATKVSLYLIYSVFNKLEINFKNVMNSYFKVFIFSVVGIIIYSILDTFLLPNIIQIIGG